MEKIMSAKEFEEQVRGYVRKALPYELSETHVRVIRMKIWDEGTRMVLLVIRPGSGMVTGFCLNDFYKDYADGNATVESAAAAIINDRRLYNISVE